MAGVLQRFERRLEGVVTNLFAWAFKSAVQPVEITSALQHDMDNNAQILSRSRVLVPNDFTVALARADYDRLSPYGSTLSAELTQLVHEHINDQGYTPAGHITIDLVLDETLRTGRFHVRSRTNASVTPAAGQSMTDTAVRKADVILEVNGVQHPLPPPGVVIGRGSEADLRIDDPGISRKHARIAVTEQNGIHISVEDLGSTNGVIVDGRRLAQSALGNGSRLQLGNTHLLLRMTSHEPQPDGE